MSASARPEREGAPADATPQPARPTGEATPRFPWSSYPEGTRAYAVGGGYWIREVRGWRWHNGGTFPQPGPDADRIELPTASERTCAKCGRDEWALVHHGYGGEHAVHAFDPPAAPLASSPSETAVCDATHTHPDTGVQYRCSLAVGHGGDSHVVLLGGNGYTSPAAYSWSAAIGEAPLASAPSEEPSDSPLLERAEFVVSTFRIAVGESANRGEPQDPPDWFAFDFLADAADVVTELLAALQSERLARETAEQDATALRARLKLVDRVCHEHHAASVMREEHDVCPVCAEYGGADFYVENAMLYRAAPHPETRHE